MRYNDIPAQLAYIPTNDCIFAPRSNAQVSQFLSELQFLTDCNATDQYIVCISAFNNNLLRSLYPRAHFIIMQSDDDSHEHYNLAKYDNDHGLIAKTIFSSDKLVHVIDDPFSDDFARAIGTYSRDNVLLIVNLDSGSMDPLNSDNELAYNNARQHIWAHYIKPRTCMLKFSVPSSIVQLDEYSQVFAQYKTLFNITVKQDCSEYQYIRADHINLQAFASANSKYAQLITQSLNIETYDASEWESKMAYYNAMRECAFFEKRNDYMFDGCHDCAMMYNILNQHCSSCVQDIIQKLGIRNHRTRDLNIPYKNTKQILDDQRSDNIGIIEGGINNIIMNTYRETFDYILSKPNNHPHYTHVDDIERSLRYQPTNFDRQSLHYGQLKLFLACMQFLNESMLIINSINHDQITWLIYAGSAPGNVHNIIATCWPNIRFILIDPMSHDIYEDPKRLYYRYNIREEGLHKNRSSNQFIHVAHSDGSIEDNHQRLTPIEDPITNANDIVRTIFAHPEYTFHIIEDLFTDDLAHAFGEYALSKNTLFMSDIRTSFEGGVSNMEYNDEKSPSDFDILINNAQQHIWTVFINPVACMLKFRTPYMNDADKLFITTYQNNPWFVSVMHQYQTLFNVNLFEQYNNGAYLHMRPTHINVQAFVGGSSTETRFVAFRKNGDYNEIKTFNSHDWENTFAYFNVVRDYDYFNHPYLNRSLGIDGCHDCALMMSILEQYCILHNKPPSFAVNIIQRHMNILHRYLIQQNHGRRFKKWNVNMFIVSQKNIYNKTTQ
jgi:hypothetical protein